MAARPDLAMNSYLTFLICSWASEQVLPHPRPGSKTAQGAHQWEQPLGHGTDSPRVSAALPTPGGLSACALSSTGQNGDGHLPHSSSLASITTASGSPVSLGTTSEGFKSEAPRPVPHGLLSEETAPTVRIRSSWEVSAARGVSGPLRASIAKRWECGGPVSTHSLRAPPPDTCFPNQGEGGWRRPRCPLPHHQDGSGP